MSTNLKAFCALFIILCFIFGNIVYVSHRNFNNFIEVYDIKKETYRLCKRYSKPKMLEQLTFDNLKQLIKWQIEIDSLNRNLDFYKSGFCFFIDREKIKDFEPIEDLFDK